MKILVVGDLHGQKPKIHFKDFDAIIAPGDFCSDESTKVIFANLRKQRENPEYKTEWWDEIGRKKATSILDNSLKDGRKILEFLNSLGKPVYLVPGNHDQMGYEEYDWKRYSDNYWPKLIKGLENLSDVHFRKKSIEGFDIIGYGVVSGPEIPQYEDDRKRKTSAELRKMHRKYDSNKNKLTRLFDQAKKPVIFMPHHVPFNTRLDKIDNPSSPANGRHYGSLIAREMIEKYQPPLCVGGHMHEHFGKTKLGKTTIINAGFGRYVNTLIDLDEDKGRVRNIKFHRDK